MVGERQTGGGGVLVELGSFGAGPFFGFRRWIRGGLFFGHRGGAGSEPEQSQVQRARSQLRGRGFAFDITGLMKWGRGAS
jgi:hypothetical protein